MNSYFQKYKISDDLIAKFDVKIVPHQQAQFEIHYPYLDGSIKKCRPMVTNKAFKWNYEAGKGDSSIKKIFGYSQLPKSGDIIVITGGEKDVLSFVSYGYPSICMNSETVEIPTDLIEELSLRFKYILICYDLDATGRKSSLKNQKDHDLINLVLPDDFEGKDISDFRACGRSKNELDNLIKEAIERSIIYKPYLQYKELANIKLPPLEYLLDGYLPKSSLIGVIGGSEGGKTLLMLQFSICYILSKNFLEFKMNGGKKVLFLSFEDDKKAIHNRLKKMLDPFTVDEQELVKESLFIIDRFNNSEKLIENHLLANPDTGLIVLDTLSEWVSNSDINNAGQVRIQMQTLSQYANQYDLSVIFIHHINKAAEVNNKFSKLNSLGSQAIEARSRVMIEVKKCKVRGTVEIGIVKGNDVPEEMKYPHKTLVTKLNPENLWFDFLMEVGPLHVGLPISSIDVSWQEVFEEKEEMKTSEILQRLESKYKISKKRAEKIISEELGTFRIEKGRYRNPRQGSVKQL